MNNAQNPRAQDRALRAEFARNYAKYSEPRALLLSRLLYAVAFGFPVLITCLMLLFAFDALSKYQFFIAMCASLVVYVVALVMLAQKDLDLARAAKEAALRAAPEGEDAVNCALKNTASEQWNGAAGGGFL